MRKLLAVVLLVLCVVGLVGAVGWDKKEFQRLNFPAYAEAASGAIFLTKGGQRKFICSGTLFAFTKSGDGLFATARHCVWEDGDPDWGTPGGLLGTEEVSFAANEGGPYYLAAPYKISKVDDVAILIIKNAVGQPAVRLGTEDTLRPGDPLLNFGFGPSLGKLPTTIRAVTPAFGHYPDDMLAEAPAWAHAMPVDGSILPGDSGSALFDPKQQAIVGIVAGAFKIGNLDVAIPISRVWALLGDPNLELKPDAAPSIPAGVFQQSFGKEHPFKLTVHGPNPVFTQAGYTFRVLSEGLGLYEPVWYAVPVYIEKDEKGRYLLTSTKGRYQVPLALLPKGA